VKRTEGVPAAVTEQQARESCGREKDKDAFFVGDQKKRAKGPRAISYEETSTMGGWRWGGYYRRAKGGAARIVGRDWRKREK